MITVPELQKFDGFFQGCPQALRSEMSSGKKHIDKSFRVNSSTEKLIYVKLENWIQLLDYLAKASL